MSAGRILTLGLGTPFSAVKYLPTLGLGTAGTPPVDDINLWGRLRQDARLRARIEAEDAELIRIVRTTIAPELLRRRTLH